MFVNENSPCCSVLLPNRHAENELLLCFLDKQIVSIASVSSSLMYEKRLERCRNFSSYSGIDTREEREMGELFCHIMVHEIEEYLRQFRPRQPVTRI